MSTAMPPLTPEAPAPQPAMSEASRLMNVFFAPSKTFEDLRRKPSWWAPWLLLSVVAVGAAFVIVQKVDLAQLAQKHIEMTKMGQDRVAQMTPEQKNRFFAAQTVVQKIRLYGRPITLLIGGVIGAAILMALFNFGFEAGVSFPTALAVFFYASLPLLIKDVLLSVSLLASADPSGIDPDINPVATNPAFFMDREAHKFLYGLASSLDVIVLWVVILMGLGFALAASNRKLKPRTAIITMLVLYAIVTLVGAGIGAAF